MRAVSGIIGDISRNAVLREGDPDAFKQMVRDMAQGGDLHTLYVDGNALVQTLREAGITMDELRATMPGVAKQVGEAAELKGYVAIPVEEYAAQAGTTSRLILPTSARWWTM